MKRLSLILLSFSLAVFLFSCDSLPIDRSESESWDLSGGALGGEKDRVNIKLSSVSVDRPGGWDSIEKEFEALAPLYFWKHGCRFVNDIRFADYTADINVREREYISGWRTKRSLAVEVRIWDLPEKNQVDDQNLPLSVGRVISIGSNSFSSSETVGRMLSMAVVESTKGLKTAGRTE